MPPATVYPDTEISRENLLVHLLPRINKSLYQEVEDASSWVSKLQKAKAPTLPSGQLSNHGERYHPYDFRSLKSFRNANTHHASCISTKVSSTVGLGLKDQKTQEALDELCRVSFLDVISLAANDYFDTGNGYIEVVREKSGKLLGMYPIRSERVRFFIESPETQDYHFVISGEMGRDARFAPFGQHEDAVKRNSGVKSPDNPKGSYSEVIHFPKSSTLVDWYGAPDWLSAVSPVELTCAILQHNYDYFNNRGVPELIFLLTGGTVDPSDWKKVESAFSRSTGSGNAYRSFAMNLANPNIKGEVIKLGGDQIEAVFQSFLDTLSLQLVSAHRVPPLLAGITIPGKLGANNELPNALTAFQNLVIAQEQMAFCSILKKTLGNSRQDLGLKSGLKFEFKTILDLFDFDKLNAGQSRTPIGPTSDASDSQSA